MAGKRVCAQLKAKDLKQDREKDNLPEEKDQKETKYQKKDVQCAIQTQGGALDFKSKELGF